MVYRCRHYLYQPSDDSDIRELEKMGIRFVPKVLKNGVIEDTMIGTDGPIVRKSKRNSTSK